jgi:hypothetical protein
VLLCFTSSMLGSGDPMVVETWMEMLKEKLKLISPLLKLSAFVDAFLGAWTSSVHPIVG